MHRRNFMRLAAALLGSLACAAACAPRSGVAAGDAIDIQIYVDNNLRGVTAVAVYLLTDAGARRSLGPIESNELGTWDRSVRPGEYQLLATRVGDDDILSERFRVDARNRLVVWALAQNQLSRTWFPRSTLADPDRCYPHRVAGSGCREGERARPR